MPKYHVHVESTAPKRFKAHLEITAETPEQVRRKVQQLYEEDAIDWDQVETDYDSGELWIRTIMEMTPVKPT